MKFPKLVQLEDYEPFIGAQAVERLYEKAQPLKHLHVANVNSTYYGGGVAEILSSFTLLMNSVGIKTGWRVIQGAPDFFSITKKCTTPCRARTSICPSASAKFSKR